MANDLLVSIDVGRAGSIPIPGKSESILNHFESVPTRVFSAVDSALI